MDNRSKRRQGTEAGRSATEEWSSNRMHIVRDRDFSSRRGSATTATARRGHGGPQGPPPKLVVEERRRSIRRPFMSRGRTAPPEPPGSERRPESFMNNAG